MQLNADGCSGNVRLAAGELQGLIVNLFSNAVDALDGIQGEILINCHQIELFDSAVSMELSPGQHVKITVEDNGSGISEDIVQRIFDPFFTTKDAGKGVGLGMSIVHSTISEAGGNIFVESELGTGTTFTIYLPVIDDETAA